MHSSMWHRTSNQSLLCHCIISIQGYCTGNLQLEGYQQPWEPTDFVYPPNLASPEQVWTCFYNTHMSQNADANSVECVVVTRVWLIT